MHAGSAGGIVFLVNNTRDRTYERAWRFLSFHRIPHCIVDVQFAPADAHAGMARCLALECAAALTETDGMMLTTDADSRADRDWVAGTIRTIGQGCDLVCGLIEAEPDEVGLLPAPMRARIALEQEYARLVLVLNGFIDVAEADRSPHQASACGASLGFRRNLYVDVGGMPAIPCGEDRAFVAAAIAGDWRVRYSSAVKVTTSCRIDGRAAGGMAQTLARRAANPEAECDDSLELASTALFRARARTAFQQHWRHGKPSGNLLEALSIDRADTDCLRLANRGGEAWGRIEDRSPRLKRMPVTPEGFLGELALLRRMVRSEHRRAV